MTYQELKDRLSKCEYTLTCIKDGNSKIKDTKTVKKLELLKESLETQLKEMDVNDPVMMKLRSLKAKIGKKKGISKWQSIRSNQLVVRLKAKRAQVMRDMEQEAEPEGGPIADKYGDLLNKIDAALAKASGTKPKSYNDTFKEGWNDQDDVFALGYDLDATQYLVDYLESKYKAGVDYELHIGRGDTHPNAISLMNPDMEQDKELGNLLMSAGDNEETDYQSGRELEKDYNEGLWANINAKKKAGKKPSHGNSNAHKDAVKAGNKLKEQDRAHKLSKNEISLIAHEAGKAVSSAILKSGDEISSAKIKDIYASALSGNTPEAFTVHIIYKNDKEDSYRFQIQDDKLYFLAPNNKDIVISDVGIKPSGEAVINKELIKNEMLKYFNSMNELEDKGMVVTKDSKEAEKLAKKGVNVKLTTEGPYQTTYVKVAQSDYKKAMAIIDRAIDSEYVNTDIVDDDGDGNVIIYFNFTTAMTGHPHYNPDVDPAEFIYDLSMDLQSRGVQVVGASHDIEEGMSDKEFADAQEADRLADHPERDKILAIQKLIAKEKGVKEDKYDDMVASDKDIPDGKRKGAAKALRMVDKGASYDKVKKYLKQERVVEVKNEFETADEWADDGRYYIQVEDNGKGGGWIIDPNHSKYTPGTKLILNVLDEQDYRFEDAEDYFLQVQRMEALKNEAEAEHLINRYGTDLVDELELHIEWHETMFPEDIEYDDDDDVDESRYTKLRDYYKKIDQMNQQSKKDFEKNPGHGNVAEPSKQVDVNEESEIDKITKAKRLIKQQAPAMNKLPQDDPKRKSFIDRVKQINQKHKELLDNEDDKISGTGRDQELDEGRGDFDDVLKAVQNMSNNDDISEKEAALEIVYALADKFKIPVDKNLEDYMEERVVKEGNGLWANIRAKRARGGKPAHKNSNAHKDAVKAGEKINKTNEYGGSQGAMELEDLFGALGYRDGFDEFIEDNPGAVEALHSWISSIPEFRKKLGAEFSNSELEDMGLYDIAGYDDDDNVDEYDIYHKQDWSDDPKEKEARKNNADRKKINKDTLDIDEVKVGDTLTKDGKKGKVTKLSDTQATVDFGNGDVYGIAHSRIKGRKIAKEVIEPYKGVGKKDPNNIRQMHYDDSREQFFDYLETAFSIAQVKKLLAKDHTNVEFITTTMLPAIFKRDDQPFPPRFVQQMGSRETLRRDWVRVAIDMYPEPKVTPNAVNPDGSEYTGDTPVYNSAGKQVKEAEARPMPDTILRGYNANVKNAQSMASALLSLFHQINDKEPTDFTSNGNIKRVLKLLNYVAKAPDTETDEPVKEAGPGFKHDCAAKVVHEKYGKGNCIPKKHTLVKEGQKYVVTHYDVLFEQGNKRVKNIPVSELEIKTSNEHWHKGYKKKKK